ncbi:diacylglycerol kinase, partial [Streptomyces toxytricini]
MSPAGAPVGGLLVLVDPVARRLDGESVRIARDVLSAGAAAKICLPQSPEEFARALARRGHRRPVIVGDDRALVRAVGLLHRERELPGEALSVVPVGQAGSLGLARTLGIPMSAVSAARAALDGVTCVRDLLVDDSDGVVLGGLRI